jgi:hypothetical protein
MGFVRLKSGVKVLPIEFREYRQIPEECPLKGKLFPGVVSYDVPHVYLLILLQIESLFYGGGIGCVCWVEVYGFLLELTSVIEIGPDMFIMII